MDKQYTSQFPSKMKWFYEIFPYPNRLFLLRPLLAHHATSSYFFVNLLAQRKYTEAESLLKKWNKINEELRFQKSIDNEIHKEKFDSRILLVGCGTDEPLLFRLLHLNFPIDAIDLSKRSLKKAKFKILFHSFWNYLSSGKGLEKVLFHCGDAATLIPALETRYSFIQCFGVLHHQRNPEILMSSMVNALENNGCLRLMLYSYHGRRMERKIQKRWTHVWDKETFWFKKLGIKSIGLMLMLWQWVNILFRKDDCHYRFRYLGLSQRAVADAFMHPSDPGFSLDYFDSLFHKFNLSVIYCQSRLGDKKRVGLGLHGFEVWKESIAADRKGELMSNPILILKKVEHEI